MIAIDELKNGITYAGFESDIIFVISRKGNDIRVPTYINGAGGLTSVDIKYDYIVDANSIRESDAYIISKKEFYTKLAKIKKVSKIKKIWIKYE